MKRRDVAALLLASALPASCAAPTLPPAAPSAPPGPAETAPMAGTGAITLRAEPVVDPDRQRQAFGTSLAQRGIVAVLVAVENRGAVSVDMRVRDLFLEVETSRIRSTSPAMVGGMIGEGSGVTAAGFAGAALLGLPGMIAATAAASDANQRNLHAQATAYEAIGLRDGILQPGARVQGYVFFTPPASMGAFDAARLILRVRSPGSIEDLEARLPLTGLGHRPRG